MKRGAIVMMLALLVTAVLVTDAHAIDLKVDRHVLENGAVVLHVERHNLPIVKVSLLLRAGGREDPDAREGLASLTASLLTEGTKNRTSTAISGEQDFIGASLGSSAGIESASLSLSVLSKDLDKGFELMGDVLLNPTFPEDEVARKVSQIKDGLKRNEEDPDYIARRAFTRAVFGTHPYGRVNSGTPESLDRITRDDIVAFYKSHYRPAGAILAVAGDITPAQLDGLINKYLSPWEGAGERPREFPAPVEVELGRIVIEKDITQANMYVGHLGIRRDNPDYYALSVMNYVLGGGGFSSRLMDSVREEKGLAYSIYSQYPAYLESGMFLVNVQTKNASAGDVIAEILAQMKAMRDGGITKEELEGAKAYLSGSFPRQLDGMGKIASFLTSVEFYGLGLDYIEKYPEYINSVTLKDIKRVAAKYLDPDGSVIVIVGKAAEAAPAGDATGDGR